MWCGKIPMLGQNHRAPGHVDMCITGDILIFRSPTAVPLTRRGCPVEQETGCGGLPGFQSARNFFFSPAITGKACRHAGRDWK